MHYHFGAGTAQRQLFSGVEIQGGRIVVFGMVGIPEH
jgi:hypothetical protein